MTRTIATLALCSAVTTHAWAQGPAPTSPRPEVLTLDEAQRRARVSHVDARDAALGAADAVQQTVMARSGWLPRVDMAEGWQRGNAPLFTFGSLLAERRFTTADFEIDRLNHPGVADTFYTTLSVEQTVFDASLASSLRAAALGQEAAKTRERHTSQLLGQRTLEAYGRVLLLEALHDASAAAVAAADADVARAETRRDAGLATDADVLVVQVHGAAARERQIDTAASLALARASLNDLVGAPLDSVFTLELPPAAPEDPTSLSALEQEALLGRADVQLARVQADVATSAWTAARAAFLPQVVARGAREWHGAAFGTRAGGWVFGAEARLNLFRGMADRARLARARIAIDRSRMARDATETRARLDVRAATTRRAAAAAKLRVAAAAAIQARETQRIVRDRYDAGLADIVALLRAAEAVVGADASAIGARVDVAMTQAAVEVAVGR